MTLKSVLAATGVWMALSSPVSALDLPVGTDKVAHFALSYVMTDQLIRAGMPKEQAFATTMFAGWLKEVVDERPDGYDLVADAAGALAATYVRVEWRF